MRVLVFLGILFSLLGAGLAGAETRQKVYSNGSWVLYSVDDLEISYAGQPRRVLDDICLAEFASPQASFQIAMLSRKVADQLGAVRGCPWVQIASPNWNFRKSTRTVTLTGAFTLHAGGSEFIGDRIKFSFGGKDDCTAFKFFMMLTGETIGVLDGKGQTLASFPTNGFKPVVQRLLSCAGAE